MARARALAAGHPRREALREDAQTPEAVAALPTSPDFAIALPGSGVTPRSGSTDSPDATRFKQALTDAAELQQAARARGGRAARGRGSTSPPSQDACTRRSIPTARCRGACGRASRFPAGSAIPQGDELDEVMAYPQIDTPMYRPLVDRSSELFLPRLNLIEQNSLTLLETNQRFIEAYMVGLNHEFARELLWREYPTDQRGSVFRQFWDPAGFLGSDGRPRAARAAARHPADPHVGETLGARRPRQPRRRRPGERGARPRAPRRSAQALSERRDLRPPRELGAQGRWLDRPVPGTHARADRRRGGAAAGRCVKTPLYEARVDPDIAFIGFDLTAAVALGGTGENPADDPGWFFVIKERPGEPRFGFDVSRDGPIEVWNDLAWPDVLPTGELVPVGAGAPAPTLARRPRRTSRRRSTSTPRTCTCAGGPT